MTIRYTCDKCGASLKILDDRAGKKGKCPKCHVAFIVPEVAHAVSHITLDGDDSDDHSHDHIDILDHAHDPVEAHVHAETHREKVPHAGGGTSKSAVKHPVRESTQPESSPQSAASMAMAMLKQGNSSEHELATGTPLPANSGKKDRKHKAFGEDEKKKRPKADLAAAARYYGLMIVPRVLGIIILAYGSYLLSSSLMDTKTDQPPLVTVTGRVTLDNAPVAGALIMFRPMRGYEPGVRESGSNGRTDADGHYKLFYREGLEGATLGLHRVEIRLRNQLGDETLSPKFNANSVLKVEVVEGKPNVHDFPLPSK